MSDQPTETLLPDLRAMTRSALARAAEHEFVIVGCLLVLLLGGLLIKKAVSDLVLTPWTQHTVMVRFRAPSLTPQGSYIELYPPSVTVALDHSGEAVWDGVAFADIASRQLEFRQVDRFHRTTLAVVAIPDHPVIHVELGAHVNN